MHLMVRHKAVINAITLRVCCEGTTNFVHGFPFVCVSIALVSKRQLIVAVFVNPILVELYVAKRYMVLAVGQTSMYSSIGQWATLSVITFTIHQQQPLASASLISSDAIFNADI